MHKILISVFLSVLVLGMPAQVKGETRAEQVSKDFTRVAKEATPAVVSIKAELGAGDSKDLRDLEMFPDDFFNFFFGEPKGNGPGFKFHRPDSQPRVAQGSGLIVSSDGIVLTNNHVIQDANKITVQLNDGREYVARVLGKDPNSDVAVLKVDAIDLPHLTLGDSNTLEVGEWVIAIGNPLGLQATLTVGVVSAKGRSNLSIANYEDFIQTDAAINRGNSGGPLMDLEGEVIGINTAIASSTGGYMGIGFAIPSNVAREVMAQILEKGSVTRGYMGVSLQPVDQDLAHAFNLKIVGGALISDVSKDSPAQTAGLKQGDIILEYNDKKVENIGTFRNNVSLMRPGVTVNLKVLRDGKQLEIPIVIGSLPDDEKVEETTVNVESTLGFSIEKLTPELAESLGYTNDKGVVVSKVDPRSAAALAGIKKGSLIMAVDQQPISSIDEFNQVVKKQESGKGVLLLVKQGNFTRYIYLKNS